MTGAVVAVSPVITIWDRAQRFFMAELGACPRCGAGDRRGCCSTARLCVGGDRFWAPRWGASSRWGRARREPVRVRHRRGHEGDEHVQGRRRRKGDSAAGGDGGDDRRSQPRGTRAPLSVGRGDGTVVNVERRVWVCVVRERSYAGSVGGFRGGSGSEWRGRRAHQASRDSGTRNSVRPGLGRDEHRVDGAVAQGGRHGGVDARAPGVEAGDGG